MKPVLFTIGTFAVNGYGLMLALGMIAAVAVAIFRAKKFYALDPDLLFNAGLIGLVFGLVGAKLMYWIVEFKTFIQDPWAMIKDIGGGFVVYGGVILGVVMPVLYLKFIKKVKALPFLEIAIPSIAIGQAIGRIGCLLGGCCYGAPCDADCWFALTLPTDGVPRFPTQILSTIGDALLAAYLIFYTNRAKFAGEVTVMYMLFYAVGRFFIELMRGDPRGTVGGLSTSEFVSILMFAAGIALWFVFRKLNEPPIRRVGPFVRKEDPKKKKAKETTEPEDEAGEQASTEQS